MIWQIAKREILTRIRTRAFQVTTGIMLVGVVASSIAIATLTGGDDEAQEVTIGVVDAGVQFTDALSVGTPDLSPTVIEVTNGEEMIEDGDIDVFAGVVVAADASLDSSTVTIRHLDPAARAATLVHQGGMDTIRNSYAVLDRWIGQAGERPLGYSREVYLDCPPDNPDGWVTELQFVLT